MMVTAPARADSRTLSREIVSAYIYAGARIGSWALLSAWIYRTEGAFDFGLLALVRGTIGILNYTSLGLAPAMIRFLAESARSADAPVRLPVLPLAGRLEYATPVRSIPTPERVVFSNGVAVAAVTACLGLGITFLYSNYFDKIHRVPDRLLRDGSELVFLFGLGSVFRLFSDSAGALLQTRERIALDNQLLAAAEVSWVVLAWIISFGYVNSLTAIGMAYVVASASLLALRVAAVSKLELTPWPPLLRLIRGSIVIRILSFGLLVWFAQLADYLYAPTDYLLIGHFLNAFVASTYAPAVQIDAGMLILITGLASVLLPRTALAHAADDIAAARRYYVRGTLASFALLTAAALFIGLLSPWIFRLWFGYSMPATRAILPLVLVNTVIGGSSAVGRSILIGIGRVKPFAIAALSAGLTNVAVSWALVRFTKLGLVGIVLGTVVAVVGRCALWMPWYVMRSLRDAEKSGQRISDDVTSLRTS